MIYTVTFNPAIDCVIRCDGFALGAVNEAAEQELYAGGKGVNVSFVLAHLGRESTALGFAAGWTGAVLEEMLREAGIATDFIRLSSGCTRVNVKLKCTVAGADSALVGAALVETAVNAPGPVVDEGAFAAFMEKTGALAAGDFLILSGELLPGMPTDAYARIMGAIEGRGVRVVVDATGETLTSTLSYRPFLVKPNDEELAQICGCEPDDLEGLIAGARMLEAAGAQNVLVSRGGRGSFLICGSESEDGDFLQAPAIEGELVNSVGAGDSMVAGFVEGTLRAESDGVGGAEACMRAYKLAQACGSATAFSPWLAPAELVERLLHGV